MDFKLLNAGDIRFSVGAVNVLTGNFVFFDNRREESASSTFWPAAALPPAFPIVKIGTDYFWDGGIVSNTPLQHLLAQDDDVNALVFQVDLFSARGTCRAPSRTCWAGRRTSCIPRAPARSPTVSRGCSAGRRAPMKR